MTESKDSNRQHILLVMRVWVVMLTSLALGVITLASVLSSGHVLRKVDATSNSQKIQNSYSACRSRVAQDREDTFRVNLSVALEALKINDNQTLGKTLDRMHDLATGRNTFKLVLQRECGARPKEKTS